MNQNAASCKTYTKTIGVYYVLLLYLIHLSNEAQEGTYSPNFPTPSLFPCRIQLHFTNQNNCNVDICMRILSFARNYIYKNKTPGNVRERSCHPESCRQATTGCLLFSNQIIHTSPVGSRALQDFHHLTLT